MVLNIGLQNWAVVWVTRDSKGVLCPKKQRKKRSGEWKKKKKQLLSLIGLKKSSVMLYIFIGLYPKNSR